MVWLLVGALWVAMLVGPLLLLFFLLPAGRDCPKCGGETLLLRSRLLRPVRGLAGLRWCTTCNWQGVTRPPVRQRAQPSFEVVPDDGDDPDAHAPWRGD